MSKVVEEEKNGKQRSSRGPSPNGNVSESDTEESEQNDNGMRIGDEYQARVPELNPDGKVDPRTEALLVWAPHPDLPESKVSEYCTVAKEKHGYNIEQALGMLFWHKHNIDKALTDLANFTPFPDEWTVEDKVLFEQAFGFHGKSFHRIRQMLPDKTIASLVKYYYSWKKTRSRTSLMDRQARKYQSGDDSDDEIDGSANSDSDFESAKENGTADTSQKLLNSKPGPKSAQSLRHSIKNKRKPPRGMYLDAHDLNVIATGPPGQGAALLKNLDAEIVSLKRTVQNNKQLLSMHKHRTASGIDMFRPQEPTARINARWTNEELLLAVQGVRKYGKDFKAIAEVIGNKSEGHIRSFFVNYKRRYNLDEVLNEYYAENGHQFKEEEDEKMEVDVKPEENGKENPSSTASPAPAMLPASSGVATAPPPLLKQPAPAITTQPGSPLKQPASPHKQQPPPLQQQQPRLLSGSRPVLQQPPPLVRPSATATSGTKAQTPPVPAQTNSK